MKKIINTNLAILLAFVLASAIFSMNGSVYAQGNEDEDGGNNENGGDNGNTETNVNPLTGTSDSAEEVAANFTEFSNATTPEDVSAQTANITGSSSPPGELDYSADQNATSANATSANATSANATSANATSANATSANATSANATNTSALQ
jgi:cytochrome c biogenesis protein ResB